MTPIIWHCHSCPGQVCPCVFKNEMNPDFIPTQCPGDGGLAQWKRGIRVYEDKS